MKLVSRALPSGTVTFVFTDVEGSTKLLHELGAEAYAGALTEHRRLLREAFAAHGGVEVDAQGDAFFYAFPTAPGALAAARKGQEALAAGPIRVRVGIHTGTPLVSEEGYVGHDVHKAARIAASGHGGQVLVSNSTAALARPDGLVDLGEHRLKDLSAPERIYQLGAGDFPPLKTLYRTNLPVPATTFLGRERELAEIGALFAQDELRLLTLTGPGGTGKTRLALQAAGAAAERFPDGVFWVALAPLRDPALVTYEASGALGAQDDLAEHIGDKRLLLLFDNFEHLLPAAEELGELLGSCPNLELLVTSRELLQLPGEQAYPVPPLEPQEGVELFLQRARSVKPGFQANGTVSELCSRLDNLPLAIELAAARVRMLSPQQLLERLSQRLDLLKAGRGVDPRQQTLRATIAWSHELLHDEEKRLFARLPVFRGGCTLEAAEDIAEADLDLLQSLIDKSLVRVREGERFWMLETIREYAAERLEASADLDELRQRHAEWFLALAEEAEPHLFGGDAHWFDRLRAEHDNLRAALDYLYETGNGEKQQQLAGALSRFWQTHGHEREGLQRLERALAADSAATPTRARALTAAGVMAVGTGEVELARQRLEEAHRLCERLGDAWGAARALGNIGYLEADARNHARAKAIFEQNLRTYEELGDENMVLISLRRLAATAFRLGDFAGSLELHEQIMRRARDAENELFLAISLCSLAGDALFEVGKQSTGSSPYAERYSRADAIRMLAESTRLSLALGYQQMVGANLDRLARALVVAGYAEAAAEVLAKADALIEEFGDRELERDSDADEKTRAMIRAQLDEATCAQAMERGRALSSDEAAALALRALE